MTVEQITLRRNGKDWTVSTSGAGSDVHVTLYADGSLGVKVEAPSAPLDVELAKPEPQ